MIRIFAVLLFIFGLNAVFAESDIQITLDNVVSVTDYHLTANNQSAVTIYLGGNDTNHIDITLYRDNVESGYHGISTQKGNPAIA